MSPGRMSAFLNGHIVDVLPHGQAGHGTLEGVLLTVKPLGDQGQRGVLAGQPLEDGGGAAGVPDLDHITGLHEIGGDVDLLA